MERLTLWAPFVIPGKKQQVHYISVKLPLSKGVLNYTSLVCAAPCNCHSLRPYWLKTTAVDRPVAAAWFEKVGRYSASLSQYGTDIINSSGNWAENSTYRIVSSLPQITP